MIIIIKYYDNYKAKKFIYRFFTYGIIKIIFNDKLNHFFK